MSDKKKPAPFDFDEAVDASNYFVVEVTRAEVLFKEVLKVRKQADEQVRVALPKHLWKRVESTVIAALRKGYGLSVKNSTFKLGRNYMSRMAGRELMVLAWALASMSQRSIEDEASPVVSHIADNWANLDANTRWWLYTLGNTQASTESEELGFGWKTALFHGLAAKYA